jgi:hypothetical protein
MAQAPRCPVGIPLDLMAELRKIKEENHTTIIGAIALLINFYRSKIK